MRYRIKMTEKKLLDSIMAAGVGALFLGGMIWVGTSLMVNKWDAADTYVARYKPVIVISESMEPTIKTNGTVFLEKEKYKDVKEGDIIMAETAENGLVMHRVISKENGIIKTKGDNNQQEDPWDVTQENYKGTVAKINNSTAGLLTFLFGDFTELTVRTVVIGSAGLAGIIAGATVFVLHLYEYITVPFFLKRSLRKRGLARGVRNEYYKGLGKRVRKEELESAIEDLGKQRGLRGLVYRYRFMMLSNAVEAEERAIIKTRKMQSKLARMQGKKSLERIEREEFGRGGV